MSSNEISKLLEKYKKHPRTEQLLNTQKQINENLDALRNAVIANDMVFMQLASLAKSETQKEPQNKQPTKLLTQESVDNATDINTSQLDLGGKQGNLKIDQEDSEEEEEEELD